MKLNVVTIDRELVKRFGFYEFVKLAFPVVAKTSFVDSEHIRVICEYCESILTGKIKRSVINVPPSSGKSTIISILFPAYAWITDPSLKIISVSYSPELSASFAFKSLELINSDWFRERWPHVKMNSWKQKAKTDYWTENGGRRFSTSKGSIFTGIHADIILLDDLNKASDTKNNFEETVKWCKETLPTRLVDQRTGRMVCIAQRLQPYDVCDYFVKELNWKTLILPMEFNPERADPLDWRKVKGEYLTSRIDEESLDQLKISLGDYAHAQLQQDPVDLANTVFRKELFNYISQDDLPKNFDKVLLSIDSAVYAKESSDYTAGSLIGKKGNNYYIIDDFLIKLDFSELVSYVENYYNNLSYNKVKVIIENKALGPALFDQLKKKITLIEEYKPGTTSKLERAHSVTYIFREGRVFFCKSITDMYMKQIIEFPNSKNDDAVDSMAQGLQYLDVKKNNMFDLFIK